MSTLTDVTGVVLRRAATADYVGIAALGNECYGKEAPSLEQVVQGHLGLAGAQVGTWVACSGGSIVGVQHMKAHRFLLGQRELDGGVLTGAMVHPDFRGLGLFSSLVERVTETAWELGCDFVMTMPNDKSFGAFKKLGWRNPGDRSLLGLPVRVARLLESRGIPRAVAGAGGALGLILGWGPSGDGAGEPTADTDGFADRAAAVAATVAREGTGIVQLRDAAWFKWRFPAGAADRYQRYLARHRGAAPEAFAVTTTDRRHGLAVGYIVDFDGVDESALRLVLGQAIHGLVTLGVDLVLSVVSSRSLASCLRRAGLRRVPRLLLPKRFHTVFRVKPGGESLAERLKTDGAWHLTLADWDNV